MKTLFGRIWGSKIPKTKANSQKLFAIHIQQAPPPMSHLIELVAKGPDGAELCIRLTKNETAKLIDELRETRDSTLDVWEAAKDIFRGAK